MKLPSLTFLLPFLVFFAYSHAAHGQKGRHGVSAEDSVKKALKLKDTIQVLAKYGDKDAHIVEFIDFNKYSQYHDRLIKYRVPDLQKDTEIYHFYTDEYKSTIGDSLRKAVGKVQFDDKFKGAWIPVYLYKGKFYLFSDCEWQAALYINDSVWAFNSMEGPFPNLIQRVKQAGGHAEFEVINNYPGHQLIPHTIKMELAEPDLSIYKRIEFDQCSYYMPVKNLHKLPIIVQECDEESDSLIDFDKVICP